MKRLLGIAALLSWTVGAWAQTLTTVTATITDPTGQAFVMGTMQADYLRPKGFEGRTPVINGVPIVEHGPALATTMNSSGQFTVNLANLALVAPKGGTWQFTMCPFTTSQCSIGTSQSVQGTSIDLSAALTAQVTAIAVSISPALSRAYKDAEVVPAPGSEWLDVTLNQLKYMDSVDTIHVVGGGGGSSITLQTNGTNNVSQTLLDLTQGNNITIADVSGQSIPGGGGSTYPAGTIRFDVPSPTLSGAGAAQQVATWSGTSALTGNINYTVSGSGLPVLGTTTSGGTTGSVNFVGHTSGNLNLTAQAVAGGGTFQFPSISSGTQTLVGSIATGNPFAIDPVTGAFSASLQGSDGNLLTSGVISGSSGTVLCTDAKGGATTSSCANTGTTFPLLAPLGTQTNPSYSFAVDPLVGIFGTLEGDVPSITQIVVASGTATITLVTPNNNLSWSVGDVFQISGLPSSPVDLTPLNSTNWTIQSTVSSTPTSTLTFVQGTTVTPGTYSVIGTGTHGATAQIYGAYLAGHQWIVNRLQSSTADNAQTGTVQAARRDAWKARSGTQYADGADIPLLRGGIQVVSTHSSAGALMQVSGTYSAGATSISITRTSQGTSGAAWNAVAGDSILIALLATEKNTTSILGDADFQLYTITSPVTVAINATTTVSISPGLVTSLAGGEVVSANLIRAQLGDASGVEILGPIYYAYQSNGCLQIASGIISSTGVACGSGGGGGGGNTTSTSLSNNVLPLANGPNSIINSLFTDSGATGSYMGTLGFTAPVLTTTTSGAGILSLGNGLAPSGVTGRSLLWSDSTTSRILMNPNNTASLIMQGISTTGTAGDCETLAANGIDTVDFGAPCNSGLSANGLAMTLGTGGFKISGPTPTCTFTSGGGTSPSCAFDTGSSNTSGIMILTTGTGSPAGSGTFTLTFANAPFSTNKPVCTYMVSDMGTGSWSALVGIKDKTISSSSDLVEWQNGTSSTTLATSSTYWVNYNCWGK